MPGFVYFAPDDGQEGIDTRWREARASVFNGLPVGVAVVQGGGPTGKGGRLLIPEYPGKGAVAAAIYSTETQRWVKAPGAEWWIGLSKAKPPRPADLLRADALGGKPVRLADGNDWVIPAARVWLDDESGRLICADGFPQKMKLGEDGAFRMEPMARYSWLSDKAGEIFAGFADPAGLNIVYEDAFRVACEALRFNYYIGLEEASVLELVDMTNIWTVLKALVDWDGFVAAADAIGEAAEKKGPAVTPDMSPTGSGVTDSSPTTDRP